MLLDISNPNLFNPTYIPLIENRATFLHLWGSASSGKSYFAAQREVIKTFDKRRARRNAIIARKVYQTLRDSCFAQLREIIYSWGLEDLFHITTSPLHIENKLTKAGMLFRGFDNVEKIKSIVGADRAWYEEVTESDSMKEILQLRTRLRGFDEHQVTLTYNPTDEYNWINRKIHLTDLPGHELHHTTYRDNLRMLEVDSSFEPFIEGTRISDPDYYRVYGLGLWGTVTEGLIYRGYTSEIFPQHGGEDDIRHYGLDFGYDAPCALVAQHVEDRPGRKKLHNKLMLYKTGLDGPALVSAFNAIGVRRDRIIVADSARPEMIRSLTDAGYMVRKSLKFSGSVLSGINDVRKFEICIDPNSKEMMKEIRSYQKHQVAGEIWLEEPRPRQVDHSMDAMRYGVQVAVAPKRKTKKAVSTSQSMFG